MRQGSRAAIAALTIALACSTPRAQLEAPVPPAGGDAQPGGNGGDAAVDRPPATPDAASDAAPPSDTRAPEVAAPADVPAGPDLPPPPPDVAPPLCISATCLSGAIAVAVARQRGCAGLSSGQTVCWGQGVVDTQLTGGLLPTPVPALAGATALALGDSHACGVVAGGRVVCVGQNDYGQLGDGTDVAAPGTGINVPGITGATALTAGAIHTCALVAGGAVKCWGPTYNNRLGSVVPGTYAQPVAVPGITGALAIAAGSAYTCAVLSTGATWCWGSNESGQLGNGTMSPSSPAGPVVGIDDAVALAAGRADFNRGFTCVVRRGGSVVCWGVNNTAQLGNGGTEPSLAPTPVLGLAGARALGAGDNHACAVLTDGSVRCWGWNFFAQLGDRTTNDGRTAVYALGVTGASAITAGSYHTCALADGRVLCWGGNRMGQLGNGSTEDSAQPVIVAR